MTDSGEDEKRWRAGLRLAGRGAVVQYLHAHPGAPGDPISDLPLHPPYPSREFCEKWCDQSELELAKGYGGVIVLATLLLVALMSLATCSLSSYLDSASSGASPSAVPVQQ